MIAQPHVRGVKCVLTDGDQVLLVRHTYGRRVWDFPGGRLTRGEDPERGANREMHEELGVRDLPWVSLGTMQVRIDGRHDEMHIFTAEAGGRPLTVDACELAQVRWFDRDRLPSPVADHVPAIVARGS
jgi:8-oxo-dGTP pyrophosphatase MutT (NUDIX family)